MCWVRDSSREPWQCHPSPPYPPHIQEEDLSLIETHVGLLGEYTEVPSVCRVPSSSSLPVCCALGLFSLAGCRHGCEPFTPLPMDCASPFSLLGSGLIREPRRAVRGVKGMSFTSPSSSPEETAPSHDIFRYPNGPSAQIGRRGRRKKSLSILTLRGSLAPPSLQTAVSRGVELPAIQDRL